MSSERTDATTTKEPARTDTDDAVADRSADTTTVRIDSSGTVDRGHTDDATTLEADGFGRTGWALTVALLTCVLVIPGIIYVYPYALGTFGLTFFGTYLVLPLIPAALLGLIAVWSMSAATRSDVDG